MRIAIVGYPLLSRRQWGLYTELDDEVHLLTPHEWPTAFESDFPESDDPVTLHQLRSLFNGQMARYILPGLPAALRRIDPDIVLTHGEPWHLNTLYTEFACEALDIPHAVFSWENLIRMPRMRIQRVMERLLLSRVNGIISGSQAAANRIDEIGHSAALTVAPESGIDTSQFTPERNGDSLRNRFDIPEDAKVVLFTGRLVAEKGVDTLVETVPQVRESYPGVHYLILGDGPEAERIAELIESRGVSETVSLVTERQPYNEMPAIHSLASVFAYPSRTIETWAEQFGFAVVEAMSSGVPVVTTNCGALPHVVGDTGLVCPEDDVDALSDAIAELLNDDHKRTMLGEKARKRAVSEYSLESVAAKHRALLEEVLEK